MKKLSFLVPAILLISGCSEDGTIGMVESPLWFKTAPPEVQKAHFTKICTDYGFKPNTTAMAQCLQNEINAGKNRASARMQAASPRRTQTNCYTVGNSVNCTSY